MTKKDIIDISNKLLLAVTELQITCCENHKLTPDEMREMLCDYIAKLTSGLVFMMTVQGIDEKEAIKKINDSFHDSHSFLNSVIKDKQQ